jgi:hypothetical protein
VRPHPLPAHVRTIRIEALEAARAEGAEGRELLGVHGVLDSCHAWREGGPLPQWLAGPRAGRE